MRCDFKHFDSNAIGALAGCLSLTVTIAAFVYGYSQYTQFQEIRAREAKILAMALAPEFREANSTFEPCILKFHSSDQIRNKIKTKADFKNELENCRVLRTIMIKAAFDKFELFGNANGHILLDAAIYIIYVNNVIDSYLAGEDVFASGLSWGIKADLVLDYMREANEKANKAWAVLSHCSGEDDLPCVDLRAK